MQTGINIGGTDTLSIQAAKTAILEIIKAAQTEGTQIAGLNALVALAKSPQSVSLSDVHIQSNAPAKRRKR